MIVLRLSDRLCDQAGEHRDHLGPLLLVEYAPHGRGAGGYRRFEKAQLLHGSAPAVSAAAGHPQPQVDAAEHPQLFGPGATAGRRPAMSAELVLPALLGLSSQSRRLESASAYHQAAPTLDEACLLGAPSPAHPTPALRRHGAYERWLLSRDTQRGGGGGQSVEWFFGSLDHGCALRFLEERVGDPRIISLVRRWLKAGILEKGEVTANEKGAPQGASVSVLLSNLYLHEVLDLWFERQVKPRLRGEAYLVRYIDDFVICFQFREDAERVQTVLSKRLNKFALALEPSKTKLVKFGRFAQREARVQGKRTETFSFLGLPTTARAIAKATTRLAERRRSLDFAALWPISGSSCAICGTGRSRTRSAGSTNPFVATTPTMGSPATGDPSTGYIASWNGTGTRCSAVGVGQRRSRGRSF